MRPSHLNLRAQCSSRMLGIEVTRVPCGMPLPPMYNSQRGRVLHSLTQPTTLATRPESETRRAAG